MSKKKGVPDTQYFLYCLKTDIVVPIDDLKAGRAIGPDGERHIIRQVWETASLLRYQHVIATEPHFNENGEKDGNQYRYIGHYSQFTEEELKRYEKMKWFKFPSCKKS